MRQLLERSWSSARYLKIYKENNDTNANSWIKPPFKIIYLSNPTTNNPKYCCILLHSVHILDWSNLRVYCDFMLFSEKCTVSSGKIIDESTVTSCSKSFKAFYFFVESTIRWIHTVAITVLMFPGHRTIYWSTQYQIIRLASWNAKKVELSPTTGRYGKRTLNIKLIPWEVEAFRKSNMHRYQWKYFYKGITF